MLCFALLCGTKYFDSRCPQRKLMRIAKEPHNQNEMRERREGDMQSTEFPKFQEISAVKPEYGTINENRITNSMWHDQHQQLNGWLAGEQTNKPQAFHIRN